jgi:hypothetical protein
MQRGLRFTATFTAAIAIASLSNAANPALPTACMLHLEGVFSSPGENHAKGGLFNEIPQQAAATASHVNVPTVSVFYQLPQTPNEYAKVFAVKGGGENVTRAQQSEMEGAKAFLKRKKGLPSGLLVRNLDGFSAYLHTVKSRYVILVGHNVDGQFAFLTGDLEDITMLEKACEQAAKKCIFVSCRSTDYLTSGTSIGVERDLTLKEGIDLAETLRAFISAHVPSITDVQIAGYLHKISLKSHLKYHVTYMALTGCSTIAGSVVLAIAVQSISCIEADKRCDL